MPIKRTRGQLWFTDSITENERHDHRIKQWITRKNTPFQTIGILDSYSFGRCLVIDDDLQSCQVDEFIYHESLVHPAMILHGSPRNVLILGGGEGATLREVLKYSSVKKVIMVDIDSSVIELCKQHMPEYSHGAFDDQRTDIIIQDAKQYIEETTRQFDVIISDLSSPLKGGPAYQLYCQEFYKRLKTKLSIGGVFCAQVDSCSLTNVNVPTTICNTLEGVFSKVGLYTCYIPSFDALWGFSVASDTLDPSGLKQKDIDQRIRNMIRDPLRFYDGETHQGMFSLPRYLREALSNQTTIITEAAPVFIYK